MSNSKEQTNTKCKEEKKKKDSHVAKEQSLQKRLVSLYKHTHTIIYTYYFSEQNPKTRSYSDYVPADKHSTNMKAAEHSGPTTGQKPSEYFEITPVKAVFASKQVVGCNDTDTMDVAFKKLLELGVLSLPVYSRKDKRYTGLVDR